MAASRSRSTSPTSRGSGELHPPRSAHRESAQCSWDKPCLLFGLPRQPLTLSNPPASGPERAMAVPLPPCPPTPCHPQEFRPPRHTLPVSFLHPSQPCPRSGLGSLLSLLYSVSFSCSLWAFKIKPKGLWPGPCAYTLLVLDNLEVSCWAGLGQASFLSVHLWGPEFPASPDTPASSTQAPSKGSKGYGDTVHPANDTSGTVHQSG